MMLKRITQSPYRCVATDYRTGQATALALDLPGCKSSTLYTMNHFGTRTSATPGSIRTTCGSTEEKYGTRAIAAAENKPAAAGTAGKAFPCRIRAGRDRHADISYSGVRRRCAAI